MTGACKWHHEPGRLTCVNCGRVVRTTSRTAAMLCPKSSEQLLVPALPTSGPGTEMKKLLAQWPLFIQATDDCPCNGHAAQMDVWGCDECERRMDEIVRWLRDEAARRGLPFVDAAGKMLVRRAIRNARRKTPPPPVGPTG